MTDDADSFSTVSVHPKEVRFAPSVAPSVTEVIDLPPPESDILKNREELLDFVAVIRERLGALTIALSGERVLRKKKDKTIFKLAKQYNLKAGEVLEKEKEINQLLTHRATLETEVSDLKKALADLHSEIDKRSRDHHVELSALQNSNRILTQKYDDRVSSLQSYHSNQCEELRRQILQSQLETDRVRLSLSKLQMKFYPRRADRIVKKTMKDAFKTGEGNNQIHEQSALGLGGEIFYDVEERRAIKFWRLGGIIFSLLSIDALCAPSRPYTIFDSSSQTDGAYYEAPWWLPSLTIINSSKRRYIFTLVCENRPYTKLQWIDMGFAGGHKLVIWDNDVNFDKTSTATSNKRKGSILYEKRTSSVRILGSFIEFTSWSGKVEKKKAPWSGRI